MLLLLEVFSVVVIALLEVVEKKEGSSEFFIFWFIEYWSPLDAYALFDMYAVLLLLLLLLLLDWSYMELKLVSVLFRV